MEYRIWTKSGIVSIDGGNTSGRPEEIACQAAVWYLGTENLECWRPLSGHKVWVFSVAGQEKGIKIVLGMSGHVIRIKQWGV